MKAIITKILNTISYIFSAAVGVMGAFCLYDWIKYTDNEDFWYVIHSNAKLILAASAIGLIFPLVSYIMNFTGEENLKAKSKAEVLMSIFLIGIIVSVVLLLSPIELAF